MKCTLALSLLVASTAAIPTIFRRQDAVGDAVAQFNDLSDTQKADFLEQITQDVVQDGAQDGDVNVEATPTDDAESASSNGEDVLANIDAVAADDGEANVAIEDSDDIEVDADVEALDDGVVNLNIQGLEDVQMQMSIKTTDGAVADVTVDQKSAAGWGKDGGAECPGKLKAKRVVATMGFCVQE